MRLTALLLILAGVLQASDDSRKEIDNVSVSPIAPLVIVGEGWSQQLLIKNVDDEDAATGTLKFFRQNGDPWNVELVGRGSGVEFFVTLFPGQMAVYETVVRQDPQALGWAVFDMDCCAFVHAQSVFRKQTAGRPDLMASIVLGSEALQTLHIPFDNRDGKFAGVGVLTNGFCSSFSGCPTIALRWQFRDQDGSVFKDVVIDQVEQTLSWISLSTQHPETVGRLGSIEISGASEDVVDLVGFSLQFAPNGAFTVITPYED